MPIEVTSDAPSTFTQGATPFEHMQRVSQLPGSDDRGLVTIDIAATPASEPVRFDRADIEGKAGVVMQERGADGIWRESWSWVAQSVDAREGMIGWLNTQGHRWGRFARMLHRRGPEELTAWIFELMVLPSTGNARAPRFEPQQWRTIDQYDAPRFSQSPRTGTTRQVRPRLDHCVCRPSGIQHSRNF